MALGNIKGFKKGNNKNHTVVKLKLLNLLNNKTKIKP